jgi:hypothetical protein
MSHLIRIVALLAAFAAAGCVSDAEIGQSSAVTESTSPYAEMHAAIPDSGTDGNVFEYN